MLTKSKVLSFLPKEAAVLAAISWDQAAANAKGLFWKKWKVRLFENKKIAKLLSWEDNRLIDVKPAWAHKDIAPMRNITCNGDNIPWDNGGLDGNFWLNRDPNSEDFKKAVLQCYWSKGNHPRSEQARKDWYRRNAGEYYAYEKGSYAGVFPKVFQGTKGRYSWTILESTGTWHFRVSLRLFGKFGLKLNKGFEVGNLWRISDQAQTWIPLSGFEMRAPVTWSILPGKI